MPNFSQGCLKWSHYTFYSKGGIIKKPKKLQECIWATFVRKLVTKAFQNYPNLVTVEAINYTSLDANFYHKICLDLQLEVKQASWYAQIGQNKFISRHSMNFLRKIFCAFNCFVFVTWGTLNFQILTTSSSFLPIQIFELLTR